MRIQSTPRLLKSALGALKKLKNKSIGKKNIPSSNNAVYNGKKLAERSIQKLADFPTITAGKSSNEIFVTFWSHWSGQTPEALKEAGSLTKVTGAALLAIKSAVKYGDQMSACNAPGILIRSSQAANAPFKDDITVAVNNVLAEHQPLHHLLHESDGVLKTPVVITPLTDENRGKLSEAHEKIASGIYFDPRIVTKGVSATAMRTLYVDTSKMSPKKLEKGLKKGLQHAVTHANKELPQLPELSRVNSWSDLLSVHEQNDEAGLKRKFHVEDLPDLQALSSWTELPDQYLTSRELIQKYLRMS